MWREVKEKLLSWKQKPDRLPLVLYGARQIGKTFILKEFASENYSNYHYLNFEEDTLLARFFDQDLKPKRILKDLSVYLTKDIDLGNDLLIFDEIQICPRALTSLKYFAEELPQLSLVSAGSLLGLELSPASFPVGKVEQLHMYPMRFLEFLRAIAGEKLFEFLRDYGYQEEIPEPVHEKLFEHLKEYFIVGGMPKVVEIFAKNRSGSNIASVFESVRGEQQRIIESVLADIAKHSGKENSMNISKTWQYMPAKLDSNYDGQNSRFRFKGVLPGKERYRDFIGVLDWLEKANLVIKVPLLSSINTPLNAYLKENIFKLYNYDIGMLARLSNLSPQRILNQDYGSFKGFFVENFIAQELRFLIPHIDSFVCWKNKDYELEFVFTDRQGELVAIEVKAGQKKTCTSLRKFIEKYNPKKKVILSRDLPKVNNETETYSLPLYVLLDRFLLS